MKVKGVESIALQKPDPEVRNTAISRSLVMWVSAKRACIDRGLKRAPWKWDFGKSETLMDDGSL